MLQQTSFGSNRSQFQLVIESLQVFAVSPVPMQLPTRDNENWFRLEAISLVDTAKLQVQHDTYKQYRDEPTSTTVRHLRGLHSCPLASYGFKRLVPLRTSPLSEPFRVTNPKPKRWRTAIKARENQLLTLAKEALQEKKERKVINFLNCVDQDIAA